MLKLKHPYISVSYPDGPSFGGSQRKSGNKIIASCGCGLVAAVDLLIYITRNHSLYGESKIKAMSLHEKIPENNYRDSLIKMALSYFPLVPWLGMNGLGLMTGMQAYFTRYK